MSRVRQNWILLVGAFVMIMAVMVQYVLLRSLKDMLVIQSELTAAAIPYLKSVAGVGSGLFFGLSALICRDPKRCSSLLRILLFSHVGVLLLATVMPDSLAWTRFIYCWFAAVPSALLVLILGQINQHIPFRQAALFYPFASGVGGWCAVVSSSSLIWHYSGSEATAGSILQVVLLLALVTVFSFVGISRSALPSSDEGKESSWGYWVALLVLLIGIKWAPQLINLPLKSAFKVAFPSPREFATFIGNYSQNLGLVRVMATFASLGVGALLLVVGRRIWMYATTVTAALALMAGSVFFGIALYGGVPEDAVHRMALGSAICAGLLAVLSNLKELVYFAIPLEKRFSAKIAIELALVPLAMALVGVLPQALLVVLGDLASLTPYLAGLYILCVGLLGLACFRIGVSLAEK